MRSSKGERRSLTILQNKCKENPLWPQTIMDMGKVMVLRKIRNMSLIGDTSFVDQLLFKHITYYAIL